MRLRAAWVALLAACALGAAVPAGCGGGGGGQRTLRVGYAFGFDIGDVADRVGFEGVKGIDVRYREMNGGTNAISALVRGDIDMADLSLADLISAIGAGADVRAIMVASTVPEYLFVARPPFDALAKLRGARVGLFAKSSVITELTKVSLRPAGLGLGDVKSRPLADSTTRAAALASGRIDATLLEYVDYLRIAPKVAGLKVLNATRELVPVLSTPVFAVSGSYARSHRDLLRKTVRGLVDGYREL